MSTYKNFFVAIAIALAQVLLLCASQDVSRPRLVVVGQIARVDSLLKSFELKNQQEVNNQPSLNDGITLGTTIGKTAPGQRSSIDAIDTSQRTLPAGTTGTRRPTATDPGRQTSAPAIRTAVFMTDATVCKDGKKAILCGELKTNDLVQVTGDEKSGPKGFGVYATEILRTKQVR